MSSKHPDTRQSGDRNAASTYQKDAQRQAERNKQNRKSDHAADRADEQGTGNREPRSPGST